MVDLLLFYYLCSLVVGCLIRVKLALLSYELRIIIWHIIAKEANNKPIRRESQLLFWIDWLVDAMFDSPTSQLEQKLCYMCCGLFVNSTHNTTPHHIIYTCWNQWRHINKAAVPT